MKTLLLLALLLLLGGPAAAQPAEAPQQAPAEARPARERSLLDDPEWRKSFLGSYGFLSGAEPQVREDELAVLREVIDLMKANPRAAATMLSQQTTEASSAALDFILANLEFQNGEEAAALGHYRSALKKFPDFRRAHKNLGLLLVQKGEFATARGHLGRAVELGDRDGRSYGLLGYCYVNLENFLAAEEAYRNAILMDPDTRDWKLGLARSLLALQKYREAVALFGELIEANPEDATSWMLQANAYVGLEEPMAAAVNLEAVRMLGKAQGTSLVLLGDIYMNAGMAELAKSAYLEAIEKDADAAQFATAYRAAELLIRTRAYADAKEVLASIDRRYAKKLTPDEELRVLTLRGKIARAEGRQQEAAQLLESIVSRDGTRGDALLELAAYHRDQGNLERAILLVERAEKLDAYRYQALLDHAQLRVSAREYAEAAGLLREALEIKREPRVEAFLARVEQAVAP